MQIYFWQIIALSFLGFFAIVENLSTNVLANQALILGTITGLIMGDIRTGLIVGATLQLMGLGIQAYGGASVPDYMTASIVGTVFAIISNKGVAFGLGVAVPVALLMIQLDIVARFFNVFFQKKIDEAIFEVNPKKVKFFHYLGIISWGLSRGLPIFIMFYFGDKIVKLISNIIPVWLTGGLSVAGGMLPAVGIAILLRYLPVKNYISYLIFGFVAVTYLNMPMFGVAILGLGLAILHFKSKLKEVEFKESLVSKSYEKGGISDEEYED